MYSILSNSRVGIDWMADGHWKKPENTMNIEIRVMLRSENGTIRLTLDWKPEGKRPGVGKWSWTIWECGNGERNSAGQKKSGVICWWRWKLLESNDDIEKCLFNECGVHTIWWEDRNERFFGVESQTPLGDVWIFFIIYYYYFNLLHFTIRS